MLQVFRVTMRNVQTTCRDLSCVKPAGRAQTESVTPMGLSTFAPRSVLQLASCSDTKTLVLYSILERLSVRAKSDGYCFVPYRCGSLVFAQ